MKKYIPVYFAIIFIINFFGLILSPVNVLADRIDELFNEGNKAYEQKNYLAAITKYEEILKYNVHHTAVYFNLANAYFKQNELGKSILYYEKAYKLTPRDQDIRENLELAKLMTVDKIETPTPGLIANFLTTFYHYFSLNEFAALTLFHFIGIIGLIILYLLVRHVFIRRILLYFIGFGIILFIIFGSAFFVKMDIEKNVKEGIVMTAKLDAHSSPDNGSEISFTIHEGKKVKILQIVENWVKIELENSWQGWVEQDAISEI